MHPLASLQTTPRPFSLFNPPESPPRPPCLMQPTAPLAEPLAPSRHSFCWTIPLSLSFFPAGPVSSRPTSLCIQFALPRQTEPNTARPHHVPPCLSYLTPPRR